MSAPPSGLRTKPRQARAIRTVHHILGTSAALLDEVGVDRFNTNLLAERAEVRVRTIYRYFENKHAIILVLADAMYGRADDSLRRTLGELGRPENPWLPAVHAVIDDYIDTMSNTPGWRGIRRAVAAVPGLDDRRRAAVARHAQWFADALVARRVELSPARIPIVARTALAASSTALDAVVAAPPESRALVVDELKTMVASYLARYLR